MLIFGGVFVTGSNWVGHDPRDSAFITDFSLLSRVSANDPKYVAR